MNIEAYILQHTTGNLYWKSKAGTYLGCNLTFAKVAGLDAPGQIKGKNDSELFEKYLGEKGVQKLIDIDQYVMNTGNSKTIEETGVNEKGEIAFYLTKKVPLRDQNGEIIGLIGTSIDITKQKEAELAKSEFIQNMSHDLRTALVGLLSVAESQVEHLPNDHEHKDVFLIMRNSSREVHEFCETVLEAASLDYRKKAGKPSTFSITTLINKKIDLFKPALLDKGLTYDVELLSDSVPSLLGHPLMLERILINLIGNAIKFTEIGGITIQYGLTENSSENDMTHQLQLVVSDSGKGIPADKQAIIFDSFTRLSPSYQGLYKGQGLGLYITQKLIHLMGGTITVASDGPGQGSTFRCEIPINLSSGPMVEKASLIDKRHRILIADNSNTARFGAVMLLKEILPNCKVDQSDTIQGIITRTNRRAYDLLLLDFTFPDGNAHTAIEHIRNAQDSKNSDTPIVALTGRLDKSLYQACLAVGMNTAIKKPLTLPMIQSLVDNLLEDKP